jgi:hypothetical protein
MILHFLYWIIGFAGKFLAQTDPPGPLPPDFFHFRSENPLSFTLSSFYEYHLMPAMKRKNLINEFVRKNGATWLDPLHCWMFTLSN